MAKKATNIWHGEFVGDQRPEFPQNFKFSDRNAYALVAKKRRDIEALGGGVRVSRNFGRGPALIVLAIPSNIQPNRFFTEDEAVFQLIASIGEPGKALDSVIKDKEPVSGEGFAEQAQSQE